MRAIKQISYNRSTRGSTSIKYIVVHDTGNPGKGANAEAHYNYFNSGDRSSSADFFVDDKQTLCVNDYYKYYTWHCGDGHGKYGISNSNSVGIEICTNSDGDYQKAVENAVVLVRELMAELKIPIERVVRHYDASRKNCPASMSKNNWASWYDFKKRVQDTEVLSMSQYEELKTALNKISDRLYKLEHPMKYGYVDENMPEYAKPTIIKLINKGYLKGDFSGNLNLTEEMLRTLVILDRSGGFDK